MAGKKTSFICSSCGFKTLKWMGKCPECGEWNTLEEKDETSLKNIISKSNTPLFELLENVTDANTDRMKTGISEFDRIMGEGIVRGSYNLISGRPGIGKSTLMLQIALKISASRKVLYLSAEESASQVKSRFSRINETSENFKNLFISGESDIDNLIATVENENFDILFVDSIQTVYTKSATGIPGSISQIKECAVKFLELAKKKDVTLFIIGHVTKTGNIAGPMLLEHMVDSVMIFDGDESLGYRILRMSKNRFGDTNETAIFAMTSTGLEEVENPSCFFTSERTSGLSGAARGFFRDGSRSFLVEIQALTASTSMPQPRRSPTGIESSRMAMILAVLEKRADLFFSNFDVFINVIGGLKLKTPAVDLPVAAALLSSLLNIPIPQTVAFSGEIGLAGEIRSVPGSEFFIKEASRMGIRKIFIPPLRKELNYKKDIELEEITDIFSLLKVIRNFNLFEH